MGYNTDFKGSFNINKPLKPEHRKVIANLNNKRHDASLLPSRYCQWVIDKEGKRIVWNGLEKFYSYREWLAVVVSILEGLGYKVNGKVFWIGEEKNDVGTIKVRDNEIKIWSSSENRENKKEAEKPLQMPVF